MCNKVHFFLDKEVNIKLKRNSVPSFDRRQLILCLNSDEHEVQQCRICYEIYPEISVIQPCKCKGTMGAIHLLCLERWLEESNRSSCELCGHTFEIERIPRYKALKSIKIFLFRNISNGETHVRNLRSDLIRFIVITPITIVCLHTCIIVAEFYTLSNYENFPPARWTTYSILTMIILLMFLYFVRMYRAMQYHKTIWFNWWQKTSTVKLILSVEN